MLFIKGSKFQKPYIIISIVTLAALLVGAALVFWPKQFKSQPEFVIEDGQSLGATARLLAERDIISSRYVFVGYAILLGKEKEFKAGRYVIPRFASVHSLVIMFSKGDAESDDIVVTVPEGTNLAGVGLIFEKTGIIKKEDLLTPEILDMGEGYLFPDTYRFSRSILSQDKQDRVNIIWAEMNSNFTLKVLGLIKDLDQQARFKTIIVASILEKEVQTEDDMMLVAGIIEKRLELGMPLELDATVAYGVCYDKFVVGKYCDVALANIVDNIPVDSAYNTYKRRGLPVGPISNPGMRAIRAALNPRPSDYLFYLSAKDGTTIFSRTATEHERARQKYLKN